jgi:hypothetical protein
MDMTNDEARVIARSIIAEDLRTRISGDLDFERIWPFMHYRGYKTTSLTVGQVLDAIADYRRVIHELVLGDD